MRESKRSVLASGFPARKNWSCGNNDLKRPKPRASDFLATALCLLAFGTLPPASCARVPSTRSLRKTSIISRGAKMGRDWPLKPVIRAQSDGSLHSPMLLALGRFGGIVLSHCALARVSLDERRHNHGRE
jgi:hypothetical protein